MFIIRVLDQSSLRGLVQAMAIFVVADKSSKRV